MVKAWRESAVYMNTTTDRYARVAVNNAALALVCHLLDTSNHMTDSLLHALHFIHTTTPCLPHFSIELTHSMHAKGHWPGDSNRVVNLNYRAQHL